jgi:aminoglycoside 3-N-acetyltransferase I
MTRNRSTELFVYDLAVRTDWQRRGIGRTLVTELLALARKSGIDTAFVPADNEDTHALDFYRAVGGVPSPVTLFTFSR